MKKTITILLAMSMLTQSFCLMVFSSEYNDSIGIEEAEELLIRAYSLSSVVNMGYSGTIYEYNLKTEIEESEDYYWLETKYALDTFFGNGSFWKIYGEETRQKLREEAYKIYTDDIAELSWQKSALDNAKPTYYAAIEADITDEYIEFLERQALDIFWSGNPFSLLGKTSDSSEDPYYCLRDHLLTFSENGNGQASAEVILKRDGAPLYENDPDEGFELSTVPVTVNVLFAKTADGWRISGGEFVNAMCNAKAARYSKITRSNYYHFDAGQIIVDKLIANHFSDNRSDVWADDMKATYLSDKYVKYIMSIDCTAPNGEVVKGTYSAYYKYVSKEQYLAEYATEEDKKYEDNWSSDDMFMVLYGGGLYDLLVNGNLDAEQFHGEKSAYTGDGDNVKEIIIFTSAAIAAACACLCVIRKRKKTE